eukprot:CAMPEP_0204625452 /NCGR_PEP_ID=MMETSP0717-20131115/11211_1 /ASSEMBLY_ACC=CAM_ASM_000666 /TAXON_ID=230516 /ORGANISM="Chaetoceros curvisetus" /LENGTH=170 /DNA_ID=CAMNT_0051641159 /DNA_START=345 /DNA_END=857 /DNA_ORIENTATION=-
MVSGSPQMYIVNPPMGGKNIFISGRVISSGYIPLVMRKIDWRNCTSVHPKRLATSGRYQTGSIAALEQIDCPDDTRIFPSGINLPAAIASLHSGRSMCAFVTAIVGRISNPLSRYLENACVVKCPKGSILAIFLGLDHEGCGPILKTGEVSLRFGTYSGFNFPAATAKPV